MLNFFKRKRTAVASSPDLIQILEDRESKKGLPSSSIEVSDENEPTLTDSQVRDIPVINEEVAHHSDAELSDAEAPVTNSGSHVSVEESDKPKRFFSKLKKNDKPSITGEYPTKSGIKAVPIRMLIGYLPNASERDALEYTLGLVYKHFTQIGISHYDVFPYQDGFVYEAQEGGNGRAYTPAILSKFDSSGPYNPAIPCSIVIATSTRLVQIQRNRVGLEAVWLPEGASTTPTPDIVDSVELRPVINKRTGFLVASATLFLTGFIAMIISGIAFRLQPYDTPTTKEESITYASLPIGQYRQVISNFSSTSQRIVKVEYKNGVWQAPEVEKIEAPKPAVPAITASAPQGSSPVASAPITSPASPLASSGVGTPPVSGGPLPINTPGVNP
jgi:hypothetical protein